MSYGWETGWWGKTEGKEARKQSVQAEKWRSDREVRGLRGGVREEQTGLGD